MQRQLMFPLMRDEDIREKLDITNPKCAFNGYIGNENAVQFALDKAYKAFDKSYFEHRTQDRIIRFGNRQCAARFALYGPRSVGKTKFAVCFGKLLELPFVEIDATQLSSMEQVFEAISRVCAEHKIPLVPEKTSGGLRYYTCPPIIIFIDEVHALKRGVQDALLKASEANDGRLQTKTAVLDCKLATIIIGTTSSGKLCDAFKSRFTPIKLVRHTVQQVAEIVALSNPSWKHKDCEKVARIQLIPRQALEFASSVNDACGRFNCSVTEGIEMVAKRIGIDETGLTTTAFEALKVLADAGETGLSRKNICSCLAIEEDEFASEVLPLLLANEYHGALIQISSKHFITELGLAELQKRDAE